MGLERRGVGGGGGGGGVGAVDAAKKIWSVIEGQPTQNRLIRDLLVIY